VRIHHLAFRTNDIVRLERFYTDVLGLAVIRRDADRSVWLDAGGSILMLERAEDAEPSIASDTKELVCFAIAPSEHRARIERLTSSGVALEGRTAFTLYFRDPDGRRVGLSSYPDLPG
jgi:catechol 2,3-dioxygenase-like lactoylglutathione lyase family enzyme